jgi:TRAP-type mannitol/chloroaromatic compound transport system substrate-binding protein
MLVGLAPTAAMISPANPGMRIFKPFKSSMVLISFSGSYYWKCKDINTLFFTSMPFGMTATEQHAWFEYGGGQELMDKVYAKHHHRIQTKRVAQLPSYQRALR